MVKKKNRHTDIFIPARFDSPVQLVANGEKRSSDTGVLSFAPVFIARGTSHILQSYILLCFAILYWKSLFDMDVYFRVLSLVQLQAINPSSSKQRQSWRKGEGL